MLHGAAKLRVVGCPFELARLTKYIQENFGKRKLSYTARARRREEIFFPELS